MANRINIIGCGGTGVNIMNEIEQSLITLGDGFSDINIDYIDTSKTSIQKYKNSEDIEKHFFQIEEVSHTKSTIDGSGGDRVTNADSIALEIKRYLDTRKITERKTGEIYVTISSGSSGSGSVISPLLTKSLLERNIPVIVILIGDANNHMYAINSKNSIATFDHISKKVKKALPIAYYNNSDSSIDEVNKEVFKFLSILSLFMSGENSDIDYADMVSMIDPSMFSKINIPAGLYNISGFKQELKLPEFCSAMIGRTLTVPDVDADIGVELHHHKVGHVLKENVLNKLDNQWPISMVTFHGMFKVEVQRLTKVIKEYDERLNAHKTDDLFGTDNSELDEDTGLIL